MKDYIDRLSWRFIKKHSNLIDTNNWDEFWDLAEQEVYGNSDFQYVIPKMRKIFNESDINSLKNLNYIPNGYCYEDESIVTFVIPEQVETIKRYAFNGCINLKHIKLPSKLLIIEDAAFLDSGIEQLELPINIEIIQSNVFSYCGNLKRVIYSGTIEKFKKIRIEDGIFKGCNNLKHISCLNGTIKLDDFGDPIF